MGEGARPARIVRRPALSDPDALPVELDPVLRRVYAGRGVRGAAELDYRVTGLHPYTTLGGIGAAVALLERALESRARIVIVADYDADGATGCAVAVRGLRALGAAEVDYLVPSRFKSGYGLSPEVVATAAPRHPRLLITVDNGISSIAGVAAARDAGIEVLVTDHHLPGAQLPAADVIVNPRLPDDGFPSKALAGVGVIFYVLAALRARLRARDWFATRGLPEPNLAALLDLVALGTVADVVPLDHNNRVLISRGLARIRAGRCSPGLTALLEIGGRDPGRAVASDLAFAAGPRLNAAGRLTDMSLGIECLLTDDPRRARELAQRLDALNRERRAIEAQMREQAERELARLELGDDGLPAGLCLYDPAWHPGVVGILAGRVREATHRPVIAFAPNGDAELRGSARSVPGLNIRDVMEAVASRDPGLMGRYGGHAMAAGLSLTRSHLEKFTQQFVAEIEARLGPGEPEATLLSDGALAPAEMGLALAARLRDAGPWGQGFAEPLFDGAFSIAGRRVVGGRHLKLEMLPDGGRRPIDAIAFNHGERVELGKGARVHAAYRLDVNHYAGRERAQLVVEQIRLIATD